MTIKDLGFIHSFVPAENPESSTTLLLLHGTGGNEESLLSLGNTLSPGSALLSPRGKVLENGMPRFFRRFAEGVFDLEDLVFRTHELAEFIEASSVVYDFDLSRLVAVGYSNGANIAVSILLLHPKLLAGAVLFRPMVPFMPRIMPDLARIPVLISAGIHDPIVSEEESERLSELLQNAGANVTFLWQKRGHDLGSDEIKYAKEWLSKLW
ncbi:MAG TPA: alpha/beta hydrolase [Thermodesulfobacteriota bacterium]|nr:alpha/beta hydrolase [Thermodesulfobacteriota bacterium]